jgi:hypothetical protein
MLTCSSCQPLLIASRNLRAFGTRMVGIFALRRYHRLYLLCKQQRQRWIKDFAIVTYLEGNLRLLVEFTRITRRLSCDLPQALPNRSLIASSSPIKYCRFRGCFLYARDLERNAIIIHPRYTSRQKSWFRDMELAIS